MIGQRTIKNDVHASGVGLHTGADVHMTMRQAPANTGIVFIRTDLTPNVSIKAAARNVIDTQLATTIGVNGTRVSTIEHLMSALAGLGIDNAYIGVSAPELPIMDGSAAPFVFLIQSAGIVVQDEPKQFLKINRPIAYENGDVKVSLSPHCDFRVEFTLKYDHPVFAVHAQHASVDFAKESFMLSVSRARTFGFLTDIDKLRSMHLVQGGSLHNAIVVGDAKIINKDPLRQNDEFVKHKILDAIGDLYLLGHNLIGAYNGFKSGHTSNHALINLLLESKDAWEMVTFEAVGDLPAGYGRNVASINN